MFYMESDSKLLLASHVYVLHDENFEISIQGKFTTDWGELKYFHLLPLQILTSLQFNAVVSVIAYILSSLCKVWQLQTCTPSVKKPLSHNLTNPYSYKKP